MMVRYAIFALHKLRKRYVFSTKPKFTCNYKTFEPQCSLVQNTKVLTATGEIFQFFLLAKIMFFYFSFIINYSYSMYQKICEGMCR
jgi:hypothetical protein